MANRKPVASGCAALPALRVPPAEGWTPMEAIDALCPEQARVYHRGGPDMLAVALAEFDELLADRGGYPDTWLARLLHKELCSRPDLVLTGRDLTRDVHAARVRVPHDLIAAAADRHDPFCRDRVHLFLRPNSQYAEISYSSFEDEAELPPKLILRQVRIELRGSEPAPPASHDELTTRSRAEPKPEFTAKACRIWLLARSGTWPENHAPPTESQCLAAAREYFAGEVPRDQFRALRRSVVPSAWYKPGPRVSRD